MSDTLSSGRRASKLWDSNYERQSHLLFVKRIEAINKFSWNDNFEMFAMDRFTPGEKVLPTGTKEIWKGTSKIFVLVPLSLMS